MSQLNDVPGPDKKPTDSTDKPIESGLKSIVSVLSTKCDFQRRMILSKVWRTGE